MSNITVLTPRSAISDACGAETGRGGLVAKLLNRFANWRRRSRVNRLDDLDTRMLDDIGITRHDLVWAKGLSLDFNPLAALEDRARERALHRRLLAGKTLPGTPKVYSVSPNRIESV